MIKYCSVQSTCIAEISYFIIIRFYRGKKRKHKKRHHASDLVPDLPILVFYLIFYNVTLKVTCSNT